MVGSGDRSEKIRTYNFPQNRVTDHRIGLTLHQLDQVMDGKLQPIDRRAGHSLPGGKTQAGNDICSLSGEMQPCSSANH